MNETWIPEKCNILFEDKEKVGAILYYNWNTKNKPSSKVVYWENKERYKEMTLDFCSEVYEKDKIENYWKEVLRLNESKKLTLDTLCDAIEDILFKDMN
ncbi:MAG: hypothetical protein ABIE36_01505 [Candidatus Diapherotrites archaeon]